MNKNNIQSDYIQQIDSKHIILRWSVSLFIFLLSAIIFLAAEQYNTYFGIPYASLLFTMALSTTGADIGFIGEMVLDALPRLFSIIAILAVFSYFFLQRKVFVYFVFGKTRQCRCSVRILSSYILLPLSIVALFSSILRGDQVVGISSYYKSIQNTTSVYETYYVSPDNVSITPPREKKNLIYIYLESMETQYASIEDGGAQSVNYIANATKLAQENVSFSNSNKLGGFVSLPGSTWTMGALFSTQTGLPFSFPVDGNSMGTVAESFAPSVIGLGDILEQQGYMQEFLCGSDIKFAGRDKFFHDHGNFSIYDYYTAIDRGVIDEDYYVWWGYEDSYLYDIAKDELQDISQKGQPFNFTMLTVDTHHVGGYVCSLCENTYSTTLPNVLTCADQQLKDFVQWIQRQPFYEDTVIVITGDHPRMDTQLIGELDYLDRTIYNCFINAVPTPANTSFRQFAAMDIFPTVLGAMGFEIQGDRLGLGTNMFSQKPTLIEELSLDFWYEELQKHSDYYVSTFGQ